MAVTQNTYTGDGVNRNFIFTFTYLNPSHVKAKVAGVVTTAFTIINGNTVQFTTAPLVGASVVIYRETPSDALLADFTAGSAIRESDLELALNQVLNVSQETQTLAENQSTEGLQAQINSAAATANLALFRSAGYRNKVSNPTFLIADRADGATSTGFVCDRWRLNQIGSTAVVTRRNTNPGVAGLPVETKQFIRVATTSVAGSLNLVALEQFIEDARTLSDRQVTLSFYAKVLSGSGVVAVTLGQYMGTGGSPSSTVFVAGKKFTITSGWARYSVTFTMPTLAGKTLGTNDDSALFLSLWADAGSSWNSITESMGQYTQTVDFTNIQLEAGPTVSEFELRSLGEEQALCQRYFEKVDVQLQGYQLAGQSASIKVPFKATKRKTPIITLSGVTATGTGSTSVTASSREACLVSATKDGSNGTFTYSATVAADAEIL